MAWLLSPRILLAVVLAEPILRQPTSPSRPGHRQGAKILWSGLHEPLEGRPPAVVLEKRAQLPAVAAPTHNQLHAAPCRHGQGARGRGKVHLVRIEIPVVAVVRQIDVGGDFGMYCFGQGPLKNGGGLSVRRAVVLV